MTPIKQGDQVAATAVVGQRAQVRPGEVDQEVAQRRQRRRQRVPGTDRRGRSVDLGPAPVEEQLFLGGEVVEHRLDGDVGGASDVRDGHLVEAPLVEQPVRDSADLLPGLGFLPCASIK